MNYQLWTGVLTRWTSQAGQSVFGVYEDAVRLAPLTVDGLMANHAINQQALTPSNMLTSSRRS